MQSGHYAWKRRAYAKLCVEEASGRALEGFADKAADQLKALNQRVDGLGKRDPDALERKIEELWSARESGPALTPAARAAGQNVG